MGEQLVPDDKILIGGIYRQYCTLLTIFVG